MSEGVRDSSSAASSFLVLNTILDLTLPGPKVFGPSLGSWSNEGGVMSCTVRLLCLVSDRGGVRSLREVRFIDWLFFSFLVGIGSRKFGESKIKGDAIGRGKSLFFNICIQHVVYNWSSLSKFAGLILANFEAI